MSICCERSRFTRRVCMRDTSHKCGCSLCLPPYHPSQIFRACHLTSPTSHLPARGKGHVYISLCILHLLRIPPRVSVGEPRLNLPRLSIGIPRVSAPVILPGSSRALGYCVKDPNMGPYLAIPYIHSTRECPQQDNSSRVFNTT